MTNTDKIIVVQGAAGQQGGAAARHLLAAGWLVRALTRDPNKASAQALAQAGAEVVQADNEDRAALEAAVRGAYGVFSVQNFWLPGVGHEGEVRQGRHIADVAQAAGVQHFVYSSVGAAHRGMGQQHFTSKHEIEKHIQALGLPYTILRPVAFMENFFWQRAAITNGRLTSMGLRPDKGLQLIGVDDIGLFAEFVFENRERFLGQIVELAGDELTEPEIAATLGRVIGRPVELAAPPFSNGGTPSPEQQAMGRFFNYIGYNCDIPALRAVHPGLRNFEQWLRQTGWEDAPVEPMPANAGAWGR
jgi:uncharacterized protein YbjT (DUF2867 family)